MMRTMNRLSTGFLVSALLLGTTACGDGDDSSEASTAESAADSKADSRVASRLDSADERADADAEEAANEAADAEDDAMEGDATEDDPIDDTGDDSDLGDELDLSDFGLGDENFEFDGDSDSDFCVKARELDSSEELNTDGPESAKAVEEAMDELLPLAPAEIKDDVKIMRDLIPRLAELDADENATDPSAGLEDVGAALALVFNPANMRAMARVGAYLEQVCGVEDDSSEDSAA